MKVLGCIRRCTLVVAFAGCGPPLTQPSSVNLTGRWTSVEPIGPVVNLEVVIRQNSDGTIGGTWASDVSPPHPSCPPDLPARATGMVSGSNTVIGVQLSVVGAGDFQGQVTDSATMRGSFTSCGRIYAVTLSLAGPAPAG